MTKGVAMANKKLVDLLLQDENANVANEEFDTLSGSDWVCLLLKKPQFADKCDCCKVSDALIEGTTVSYWHKLTAKQWCDLLIKQPQFIDKCDWNKMHRGYFEQIFNKYPDKMLELEISQLHAELAECVLESHPELAVKYDRWNEFDSNTWSRLLAKQPQFADKCDWSKLNGLSWSKLLSEQPQFADKCDKWSEFKDCCWASLLEVQPQFADKCDKWENMDSDKFFFGNSWQKVLTKQPQLIKHFSEVEQRKIFGIDNDRYMFWKNFCKEYKFEDIVSAIQALVNDLTGHEILFLAGFVATGGCYFEYNHLFDLIPDFISRCNWNMLNSEDWSKLEACNWVKLLSEQPQFADKCDWSKLDGWNWQLLLEKQPQFSDKCDWSKLKGSAWCQLLRSQPQFADKCNKWSEFDEDEKEALLEEQPQLAKYFNKNNN